MMVDSLATASNISKPPQNPLLRYEFDVRHRSSVSNNVKYQKVFQYEYKIKRFMEVIEEFSNAIINQEAQDTKKFK